MKILKSVIYIFLLASMSCNSPGSQIAHLSIAEETFSKNLNAYFEALTKLKKFNGGVLVQKEGKRILYKVYNMEEDVGSNLHVSESSQFDIHSIAKLMAKACIVKLEEKDLISKCHSH